MKRAGTGVAHVLCDMRLSETITIYLAVGAPFGVNYYLRAETNRARSLARAAAATLFWPLAATAILFARLRHLEEERGEQAAHKRAEQKIEDARRTFIISIQAVLEHASTLTGMEREEMERTLFMLRESVEQYVGLAGAVDEEDADAVPGKHEMELNRIAGRRGDDLIIAGRCVHRRNASRVIARRRRARTRLLHALAELRESTAALFSSTDNRSGAEHQRMSESLLAIYGRAIDVFTLVDDVGAAMMTARLLDAECSRLNRLQERAADERGRRSTGEEQCTTRTQGQFLSSYRKETTFTQG